MFAAKSMLRQPWATRLNGAMKFHEKLTQLMAMRGISQSQLARELGWKQNAISQLASGKQRVYGDQAVVLARAMEVDVGVLLDDNLALAPETIEEEKKKALLTLIDEVGIDGLFFTTGSFTNPKAYKEHCIRLRDRLQEIALARMTAKMLQYLPVNLAERAVKSSLFPGGKADPETTRRLTWRSPARPPATRTACYG